MLKKFMATALLVCAIPAVASASWFLSTQVTSAGGTLTSMNMAGQAVTDGILTQTYSSLAPTSISTSPATGSTLRSLTLTEKRLNDATGVMTTTVLVPTSSFTPDDGATYTAAATFQVSTVSVTAGMTGGNVSPTRVGNIMYGYKLNAPLNFYFAPSKNCQVATIGGFPAIIAGSPAASITYVDINGLSQNVASVAGANTLSPLPGVNQRVRVSFPTNYVFTSAIALAGTSSNPSGTISAGLAQTITVGSTAALAATISGSGPVTWSYVSGPANIWSGTDTTGKGTNGTNIPTLQSAGPALTNTGASVVHGVTIANSAVFSGFTLPGQYLFVASTPSAISGKPAITSAVTVNVVAAGTAAQAQCQFCHTPNGIGDPALTTNFGASIHAQGGSGSSCTACHYGTGSGGHPGSVNKATVDATTFLVVNKAGATASDGGTAASAVTVPQGQVICVACHKGSYPIPHQTGSAAPPCAICHTTNGTGDAHQIIASSASLTGATCVACHGGAGTSASPLGDPVANNTLGCVGCHDVAIAHPGALVSDNSGVRGITGATGEFEKGAPNGAGYRSHHIYNGTGVDPQNAQCIACHLEGKSGPGRTVVLDPAYHMADAKVHLRSGNHAITADVAWDPASPNHTDMDNFCMSCHNAAGAVDAFANVSSALKGMTQYGTPSATNPFGDMLKNAYDGMARPQVVAVYEQFDTTNVSHHAVRGKKYTGRTRATAITANFTQYSGATVGSIHKNATGTLQAWQYFKDSAAPFNTYSTAGDASGNDATLSSGTRKTLYEANLFTAVYTTLNGSTLGDDSTLHCGDCHSVGQWKSGSASYVDASGVAHNPGDVGYTAPIAIGAHGSKNEYMLRTSNGTDALHKQGASTTATPGTAGTYVCYLCHAQQAYGDNGYFKTDAGVGVTSQKNHGGLHGSGGCESSGVDTVGKTGYAARIGTSVSGQIGSIYGYTCSHCHNSGNQIFGGIHGSASSDGSAKNLRFLTYSTDGTDVIGKTLAGGYGTGITPLAAATAARSYTVEHDTLNAVARLPYRFMGGTGLRYNGGATASKWEAKTLNGMHREGCYNLSATSDATHLWNTTNAQTVLPGSTAGNAILNNSGNDDASPSAGNYNNRTAQNNTTSAGWGSCNHHQGSSTGSSTAPTRSVQRPLVY